MRIGDAQEGAPRLALQRLKPLQNCLRIRSVGLGVADIFPANDAVLVNDECRRLGGVAVQDSVIADNALSRIVQDWEGSAPFIRRRFRAFQVVGANGENDRVAFLYRVVVVCQLDELCAAERSPECAVEDENDVAVPPIRAQRVVFAARAWQREVGRKIADIRADGRLRRWCWGGCRRGRWNGSCGRRNGRRRWQRCRNRRFRFLWRRSCGRIGGSLCWWQRFRRNS